MTHGRRNVLLVCALATMFALGVAVAIAGAATAADTDAKRIDRQVDRLIDSSGGIDITEIAPPPAVTADAWLVYDDTSNEPIATKDPSTQRPIASLAKLMTALVVVERMDLDEDVVTIPAAVNDLPADAAGIGLRAGEKWPARNLFRAMLVHSANDAALSLASSVGKGNIAAFVELMNARAKELGMSSSEFGSPTGLDAPGAANTSTPVDLVLLSETALTDDDIRSTVALTKITLTPPGTDRDPVTVTNRNPLLGSYDGVDGIKTGFTDAAGYMLLIHEVDPTTQGELIVATFSSSSEKTRVSDSRALLDWARPFRTRVTLVEGGEALGTIPVTGSGRTVEVFACDDVTASVRAGQRVRERIVVPRALTAPVHEGDEIGQFIVRVGSVDSKPTPVCSATSIPVESRLDRLQRHARDYRGAWRSGVDEIEGAWSSTKEQF